MRNLSKRLEMRYEIERMLKSGKKLEDCHLRVTYYARVSTGKDAQLNSLDSQKQHYESIIQENPNWEYVKGYVDEGVSGKSVKNRIAFERMIQDAENDLFDLILTKEISRFSRDVFDSLDFTRRLLKWGVGVFFEAEKFSTFEAGKEFELTVRGAIAQTELEKISDRVKMGFQTAIRQKHSVLGNNCIWGYRKRKITEAGGGSRSVLEIDEEQAEIVRRIFRMYVDDKYGIRKICAILNAEGVRNTKGDPLTYSSLRGILSNMKYKGWYCGGKTQKIDYRSEKMHYRPESEWTAFRDEEGVYVPQIIDEETWDRANAILRTRSEKMAAEDKTSYQNKYTYSGKIVCGEHGTRYHRGCYHYKSGDKEVWQCKYYTKAGRAACDNLILYTTDIERIVREAYAVVTRNQEQVVDELIALYKQAESDDQESKKQEDALKNKVEDVKKEKNRLIDLLLRGTVSEVDYRGKCDELDKKLQEAEKNLWDFIHRQEEARKHQQNVELLRELIAKEMDFEDGLPPDVVDSLLDRIEVYKTDAPRTARLKVFFRVLPDECMEYDLTREKNGVTSVCSVSHT